MVKRGQLLCGALVLAACHWACADTLPLHLDWAGSTVTRAFPVTGGVPFARGVVHDHQRIRLLHDGKAVPLQTEVLAWWPDKSVKWVLLDFQASPAQTDFSLAYGARVPARSAIRGIEAAQRGGEITVDTGLLQFTVRQDGGGFLDTLAYTGKPVSEPSGRRTNVFDFLHTKSPADYHPNDRNLANATPDPSRVVVDSVSLETAGPLRATVLIGGRYTYEHVGSTITGTDVKGDCPFRLRVHAYAGQSLLRVEHFFYYEGDGDHDFAKSLGLKLGLPPTAKTVRFLGEETTTAPGPLAGLYQKNADEYAVWNGDGRYATIARSGRRFEGVLDVVSDEVGIAIGIDDFWQNAAKSLHADLRAREASLNLWPPEAPPLDFRRHAREWSVGETGEPDDKEARKPAPFRRPNYRLASKGVGKTHHALLYLHAPDEPAEDVRAVYQLFDHRPLLWAPAEHYASTLALGRYRERVPGEHDEVEECLDRPIQFLRYSQDAFRWYGFWLYGNVCQNLNGFLPSGRWCREFGRWGWANGDSMGRLAYALMLQALRKCSRDDLEFAETYLRHVHDVCATHTRAYPHHNGTSFRNLAGAAHRHGAWPWACPYVGIRGAHPVGAKIHYFLTGDGHTKDLLDELTQLVLEFPNGGEGDGPLGPNAQIYLYQWETTGDDQWRERLKAELESSEGLKNATGGWLVMMNAAFGIQNALDEYMDLSGDDSLRHLAADYADRCLPAAMKRHWTWGGYFRVYASAYNYSGNTKYRDAITEMLDVLVGKTRASLPFKIIEDEWPGEPGGPRVFYDGNIIRDVPFALYALHADASAKGGQ